MPQAVVYTDFDGVLNAFVDDKVLRRGGQANLAWLRGHDGRKALYDPSNAFLLDRCERIMVDRHNGYRVHWSAELAADLAKLASTGLADLEWLTTWQPYTDRLNDALGWDAIPVDTVQWYDPVTYDRLLTGKFGTIKARARVEMEREHPLPIIWIDDEECTPERRDELEAMVGDLVPILMVRPDSRIGISRRQWRLITDMVATPERHPGVTLDEEPTLRAHDGHLGF
ncbi:MAG: hypothetical protein UHD09_05085 [Bifidobacterium sp.]|nr:hypothetical protein [Bifidobacterium sp.]